MEKFLTIDKYLKIYPNASLHDYDLYVKLYESEKMELRRKNEDNFDNWLKEQEGKWFLINFNNTSYLLSKYLGKQFNARPRNYSLCFSKDSYGAWIEDDRFINYLWLNELNPFSKAHLPGHLQQSSIVWAKPISDEEANKYFEEFNNIVKPFVSNVIEKN